MIKLFVGLGNPGPEYQATRHNAGFWWLDEVARSLAIPLALDRSYQSALGRGSVNGQAVWLLQPMTFMNLSGRPVAALARFYKIAPENILVAHDDMDIAPGEAKLKRGGGHGGHNGLRDIHAQLGSSDYWRLRIGIGHPGDKSEVLGWVLKKPSMDHQIAIAQSMERARLALPQLLSGAMEQATLQIHTSKPARPKPPRKEAPNSSAVSGNPQPSPANAANPADSA